MDDVEKVYPPGEAVALFRGWVRSCGEQGEAAPDFPVGENGVAQAVVVPAKRYERIVRELDAANLELQALERVGNAPAPGEGLSLDDLSTAVADWGSTGRA
ncbi:hypothetical protein [Streptomyces chartreusis]|uniref:Uncharacterized protein n=1 Tax=Streptomyces chartreusis TaxID=1969 RepID=A0A7H8TKT0_STRCX|nr:hypothetical protein [Streptomyces chartreusis]QKZ23857.1 hypothetical protein HUT05_44785 [Streptomyces chartreusis]